MIGKISSYKYHLTLILLNVAYLASLFYVYFGFYVYSGGSVITVGGLDVSQILTYFTRIENGQIPYLDYYPIYGPLFYYLTYFIFLLAGGDLSSFYLSYWVIWNSLGYAAVSIFAFYLFEKKRYACYMMLIVFIYNSTSIGGNGYSLRLAPLFLLILPLLKRPDIKGWDLIFGMALGVTYFYSISCATTLLFLTSLFFLLTLFKEPKINVIRSAAITAAGFCVPMLLWTLFLAYNGQLSNTFFFIIAMLSRGSGYLAQTPFDSAGLSLGGLLEVFCKDQYFYLLVFSGYGASLLYLLIYFFYTKRIDKYLTTSILLISMGILLSRRILDAYWRSQAMALIPLASFLFYTLEDWLGKRSKRKAFFFEGAIVLLVVFLALATSNHVRDFTKSLFRSKDAQTNVSGGWHELPNGQDFNFKQYYTPTSLLSKKAETIDQEIATGNDLNAYFGYPGRNCISQGFKPKHSGRLTRFEVELEIADGSPTGTVTCYLYNDNDGKPGWPLGTIGKPLGKKNLSRLWRWYSFNEPFATAPKIRAGKQYHLVLYTSNTGPGYIRAHSQSGPKAVLYPDGQTHFAAANPPLKEREIIYFEKAGLSLPRDEKENYEKVVNYLEEKLDKDETFYTYPWGLYYFFSHNNIPGKIHDDSLLVFLNRWGGYEEEMIDYIENKKVRYIVANLNHTLGMVGKGQRWDVRDYIGWGDASSPAFASTGSKLALFILENYETVAEFPKAIILRKRNKKKIYPANKLTQVIEGKKLRITGAHTEIKDNSLLLTKIKRHLNVTYIQEVPPSQFCSLIELELNMSTNPFLAALTQGIFHTKLCLQDESGKEYSFPQVWDRNQPNKSCLRFPFTHTPIKIRRIELHFDFSPSRFNAPPSKIVLNGMHLYLHRDKGYTFNQD